MKHLENFKSEYIQGIYDFLEQDADVTKFKRDLIAVAEYKKIPLHDLEAELFQYADLMKEDLKDKIVFIFRDTGYLGMFGSITHFLERERVKTVPEYKKLKIGDDVSLIITSSRPNYPHKRVIAKIWLEDGKIFAMQDYIMGKAPENNLCYDYGKYAWIIYNGRNIVYNEHEDLIMGNIVRNLITDEKKIKELKESMHFALVI